MKASFHMCNSGKTVLPGASAHTERCTHESGWAFSSLVRGADDGVLLPAWKSEDAEVGNNEHLPVTTAAG